MSVKFKAACIQNCATDDVRHNILRTLDMVRDAASQGATFIALPEYFSGLRTQASSIIPVAFAEPEHPVLPAFIDAAKDLSVDILLGSIGIIADDGRIFNRSYLIDKTGQIKARYNKIHMFDVDLGAAGKILESATIAPGEQAVLTEVHGIGLGLSICYDLRFAALYRTLAQAGAGILAIPAAFTKYTGQAHWHILNRARAIENGAFVIAPCQWGSLSGGGECYGHSLIISPWGEILGDAGVGEAVLVAEIDPSLIGEARGKVPSLTHDRSFALPTSSLAAE